MERKDSIDGNARLALSIGYSLLGDGDKARALADRVKADYESGRDLVLPGTLAITYACLGERETAIGFLLEARENEDVELLFLDDPCFDDFRADPRFIDLVRGMNLPGAVYLSSAAETGTAP